MMPVFKRRGGGTVQTNPVPEPEEQSND